MSTQVDAVLLGLDETHAAGLDHQDDVVERLEGQARRIMTIIAMSGGIIFTAILVWIGTDFVWHVRQGGQTLDRDRYLELEKPSERVPVMRFGAVDGALWDAILEAGARETARGCPHCGDDGPARAAAHCT